MKLTNNETINTVIALLASLVVGAVLATITYFITRFTGLMIGYVSWGIGFSMAYVFLKLNDQKSEAIHAAFLVFAFVVFFYLSNFMAAFDASVQSLSAEEAVKYAIPAIDIMLNSLSLNGVIAYFSEGSSFIDILFYAIGILPIYNMIIKNKQE